MENDTDRAATTAAYGDDIFAVLFDEAPVGVAVCTLDDGRFLLTNRAACDIFGVSRDEILQRCLWGPELDTTVRQQLGAEPTIIEMGIDHPQRGQRRILASIRHLRINAQTTVLTSFVNVSERRQELADSQALMRAFLDRVPAVMSLKTTDGRELWASSRASDVFPSVTPDVADTVAGMESAVLAGAEEVRAEITSPTSAGAIHTYDLVKFPIRSELGEITSIGGIGTDVTWRLAADAALRESEQRFRQLASSLREVFILWALDPTEVLYMSPSVEHVFGVDPDTRDLGALFRRVHPDDSIVLRDALRAPNQSAQTDAVFRIVRDDGEVRWIQSHTGTVAATSGRRRRSTILRDITVQHEADHLVQLARSEAEQANRAKSDFLSRMGHELRTPLNAVLGFGELLRLADADVDRNAYIEQILVAGSHLLGLIDDVLDISRIEAGDVRMALEPVAVSAVVRETLDLIAPAARAAGVHIVDVEIDPALHVNADRLRLRQVLLNLLSNAVKYNRRGGSIRLRADVATGDRVTIVVADDGPGIPTSSLSLLFTPFERLGAEAAGIEGTGLGLALARQLTELMGGTISADSVVGVGSQFWIELSVVTVAPGGIGVSPAADVEIRSIRRSSNVLLVEDNPSNITLFEEILKRRPNVMLTIARTGEEAIRRLDAARPDLVLLDLHLPDISGQELLARVTADPRTRSVPVVVVSADATDRQRDLLTALGAVDFLRKPVDIARLLEIVDMHPAPEDGPADEDAAGSGAQPELAVADRFQLLVDAVEEYAIFMLDPDGKIASWNSGAQRIKGYSAAEVIGRYFSMFYTATDRAAGKPERELVAAATDGSYREEGWRVRKNGTSFWANVVITAVRDGEGHLHGFAKVTRDETQRRSAEAAAHAARIEAEVANAAKDHFLSRMSHELRTPLNSILGFGQLLALDELTDEQRSSVDQISRAGAHLLGLIDEVLDISQIARGEMRLSLEPVRLDEVVDEVIAMMRPLGERRNISVESSLRLPVVHVVADRLRFKQVVVNLLANAVKYNRDGGTVRIDGDRPADDRFRLIIRDTGIGIAAGDLTRLFQPFERLSADEAHVEGAGLGLVLTKQLIIAMGGQIGVTSEVGRGSSFWVELPLSPPADIVERTGPDLLGANPAASIEPITVLYVEDNGSNIRLLERIVARNPNVTLLVAMQGSTALDLAVDRVPDLILLDLHLPDMSGEEVLRRLRADARTALTPIVVLTADATAGNRERLLEQGADEFVTKPLDVHRVIAMIGDPAAIRRRSPASAEKQPRRSPRMSSVVSPLRPDLGTISHDLTNLLGVVLNYTTLVARRTEDDATNSDLGEIATAASQAVELVRSLIDPHETGA